MTPATATATPPTTISVIEEQSQSYTPRADVLQAPTDAPCLHDLGSALQALADLDDGWDSYGAVAPRRTALSRAWTIASTLCELGIPPQVFPTRRGGVQLEWHTPAVSLEWEIDPSGGTGLFIFDNHATGETYEGEVPSDVDRLGVALAQVYSSR